MKQRPPHSRRPARRRGLKWKFMPRRNPDRRFDDFRRFTCITAVRWDIGGLSAAPEIKRYDPSAPDDQPYEVELVLRNGSVIRFTGYRDSI